MFIDTHCHLTFDSLYNQLDNVIKNARAAGVEKFISVGTTPEENSQVIELIGNYEDIYGAVGIHPHEALKYMDYDFLNIKEQLQNKKIVAIGETGLDYFYDLSPKEEQEIIFKKHIELAQETGLPLIIHMREAEDVFLDIVNESFDKKAFKAVMHCYSSTDKNFLNEVLKFGFYISFSGIITFKKSEDLRKIVSLVPLDKMLIETDSPYLAPVPYRGKMNEPAYMTETAKKISLIKNIDISSLKKRLTKNSVDFLKLK